MGSKQSFQREAEKEVEAMVGEDFYLMDTPLDQLLLEPIENIHGWLCSVKIASGDIDAEHTEGLVSCSTPSHGSPNKRLCGFAEYPIQRLTLSAINVCSDHVTS